MKQMNLYGITSININDTEVHTCNVRVLNTIENAHICSMYGSTLFPKVIKSMVGKGYNRREQGLIEFKFTTTNGEAFRNYTQRLGNVLKLIAQQKLKAKYAWTEQANLMA